MKIELKYNTKKRGKIFLAFIIDFFISLITFLLLLFVSETILQNSSYYKKINKISENKMCESGLYIEYEDSLYLISSYYYEYDNSIDTNEKNEKINGVLNSFYKNEIYFLNNEEYLNDYKKSKLNAYYEDDEGNKYKLFNDNYEENKDGTLPSYFKDFYSSEVTKANKIFLTIDKDIIRFHKYFSSCTIAFLVSYFVFVNIVFYLLIPLLSKRNRNTIGEKIFKIGLINENAFSIKTGKYLLYFLFNFIVINLISIFSFFVTYIISIACLLLTKNKQDLASLIFKIYYVDIENTRIYLSKGEYASLNLINNNKL